MPKSKKIIPPPTSLSVLLVEFAFGVWPGGWRGDVRENRLRLHRGTTGCKTTPAGRRRRRRRSEGPRASAWNTRTAEVDADTRRKSRNGGPCVPLPTHAGRSGATRRRETCELWGGGGHGWPLGGGLVLFWYSKKAIPPPLLQVDEHGCGGSGSAVESRGGARRGVVSHRERRADCFRRSRGDGANRLAYGVALVRNRLPRIPSSARIRLRVGLAPFGV